MGRATRSSSLVSRAAVLTVIASLATPGIALAAGTLSGVGTATRSSLTHPSSNSTKETGNFRKYTAGGNNIYVHLQYDYYNPYTGGWNHVTANSNRWNDSDWWPYSVTLSSKSVSDSSLCEDRAFRVDPCS